MGQLRFEAEVACTDRVPVEVVRGRTYGSVHVAAEWGCFTGSRARVTIAVTGDIDERDAPAYVELFFHDVFLLLNLAAPGSFDGVITTAGGRLQVRELRFDARAFAHASARVPLDTVIAWYEGLDLGTRQIAASGEATALFQLLHLAREQEDEERSILHLASAAEALAGTPESCGALFALRDNIARGRTAVFHPMHDDALDPRVEDATAEWIEAADRAAAFVIGALQERALLSARPH